MALTAQNPNLFLVKSAQDNSNSESKSAAEAVGKEGAGIAPASGVGEVIQRAPVDVNMGAFGMVQLPDVPQAKLPPDKPIFSGSNTVAGHPVAGSMEALVTPNHGQGSSPKALGDLFEKLPTKGSYKSDAEKAKRGGTNLYIKGHLLNDNLGGLGDTQNLFPITHQANVDHERKVEQYVKTRVNDEGGIVHYRVVAAKTEEGDIPAPERPSALIPQRYVNGTFSCYITEFGNNPQEKPSSQQVVINSRWIANKDAKVQQDDQKLDLKADAYAKASRFNENRDKVKKMPRALVKKEWDVTYITVAGILAQDTGFSLQKWLQKTVNGIGKKGADLLTGDVTYANLSTHAKRNLTNARKALKDFIDEFYQAYIDREARQNDDTVADVLDKPTAEQDHVMGQVQQGVKLVDASLTSIGQWTSQIPPQHSGSGLDEKQAASMPQSFQQRFVLNPGNRITLLAGKPLYRWDDTRKAVTMVGDYRGHLIVAKSADDGDFFVDVFNPDSSSSQLHPILMLRVDDVPRMM